ncbi:MAG: hypothetical protein ISR91_00770 [Candidatus Delongbacteria bacterium]|nr:hypothetical protein [Candidatus Delongbacteria bacterium]
MRTTMAGLLLALLLTGCHSGDGDDRYDELIDAGWRAYSAGNYTDAQTDFLDAARADQARAEAWNGLAWTEIELHEDEQGDEDYLFAIDGNFQAALARSDNWAPPLAGIALTRTRLGEPSSAIHFAGEALTRVGDSWVYNHNQEVTGRLMRWVRAWNYFLLEDYAASQLEVEAVLEVTLDPEDPDYLSQLLAYIEQL